MVISFGVDLPEGKRKRLETIGRQGCSTEYDREKPSIEKV